MRDVGRDAIAATGFVLYPFRVSATYTVMSGLGPDIHVFLCYEL
jgi:hypothetical protein